VVIKATVVVPVFYASLPTCSNLCCLETPVRGNFYWLSSHILFCGNWGDGGCSCFFMHLFLPVQICVVWRHQWGVIFSAYPVSLSYEIAASDDAAYWWLPFVFRSCLLMIIVCDVDTHICAIWASVIYCLWTDTYILGLSSLMILACDRGFLTSSYMLLALSTCPIPNDYIVKILVLLFLRIFDTS